MLYTYIQGGLGRRLHVFSVLTASACSMAELGSFKSPNRRIHIVRA